MKKALLGAHLRGISGYLLGDMLVLGCFIDNFDVLPVKFGHFIRCLRWCFACFEYVTIIVLLYIQK